MSEKNINSEIKNIVSGLLGNKLLRVILFGSQAWKEAAFDSDYDLMIVLSTDLGLTRSERLEISSTLNKILVKTFKEPFDILIRTEEEVSKFANIVGSLSFSALKEGVSL